MATEEIETLKKWVRAEEIRVPVYFVELGDTIIIDEESIINDVVDQIAQIRKMVRKVKNK